MELTKSDSTNIFSTDCGKISAVIKPASFPLQRMEDFVDCVGSAHCHKIRLAKRVLASPSSASCLMHQKYQHM